jgi:hypothetical protein
VSQTIERLPADVVGEYDETGARSRLYKTGLSLAGLCAAVGTTFVPGVAQADDHQSLLVEGSHGSDVANLQHALRIQVDGDYGPSTRNWVIYYQRQHGLKVDGIVGPQTSGSLSGSNQSSTRYSESSSSYSWNASDSSSSNSLTATSGFSIPTYIVMCESGGNYHAVNSSTGAGGAYQIMPSTWHAYGGKGLPQNGSKQQQDAIALKIYQSQGSSPWSCAR